jgi:hypothetical protein
MLLWYVQDMPIEQRELWELLPGAAGGQEVVRQRGRAYFAQIGARGGRATRDRYGVVYLREIAQRGGETTRAKYHHEPRTIYTWYGAKERVVPYWPTKATKRRKHPIYVHIELEPPIEEFIQAYCERVLFHAAPAPMLQYPEVGQGQTPP